MEHYTSYAFMGWILKRLRLVSSFLVGWNHKKMSSEHSPMKDMPSVTKSNVNTPPPGLQNSLMYLRETLRSNLLWLNEKLCPRIEGQVQKWLRMLASPLGVSSAAGASSAAAVFVAACTSSGTLGASGILSASGALGATGIMSASGALVASGILSASSASRLG